MSRTIMERTISVMLLCCLLASCVQNPVEPNKVTKAAMLTESAKQINRHIAGVIENVRTLDTSGEYSEFLDGLDLDEMESYLKYTGEEMVRGLEEEEGGENMIAFVYNLDKFSSTDEVYKSAETLIKDQKKLDELKAIGDDIEQHFSEQAEKYISARALTSSQRSAFYQEIKKLTIKSIVLFTAALVYSILPSNVFWGKVTAAAAFSIAAGVLAATVLNLIEYYRIDKGSSDKTFASWIEDLSVEPAKYWAVALGFLNTYKAMNISPLLGGILLAVFTIAGIADDVKPLLKEYNLNA